MLTNRHLTAINSSFYLCFPSNTNTEVPDGSYITTCPDNNCDPFLTCPAGWIGAQPPSNDCTACEPGRASTFGAVSCGLCEAGKFSHRKNATVCTQCSTAAREYSDAAGSNLCKTCNLDQSSIGTKCTSIPIDRSLPVPKNVEIRRTSATNYNNVQIQWTAADEDDTTLKSFIVTISTSADFDTKVANVSEVETTAHKVTFISSEDIREIVLYAKVQSVGYNDNAISGSSVISKEWPSTGGKACPDSNEYINCSSLHPSDWYCEQCPEGSSCKGSVTWKDAKAVFGWSRCKNDRTFEQCLGEACLGAANPLLVGQYINNNSLDPATIDQPERCADGHANPPTNNTRCSRCLPNYAPVSSLGGKCIKCTGEKGQGDTAVLVIIGLLAFMLFALLIGLKMKSSGRKKAAHSTLKRTLLTHVQMISIVMSLNVRWPEAIRTILVGVSGVISVSGHTSALHCSIKSDLSTADIHYATLCIAAVLPLCMCVCSWMYWFVCVPRVPACGCTKKLRVSTYCCKSNPFDLNARRSTISELASDSELDSELDSKLESEQGSARNRKWKSTRDGWIATNVYFVYIIFPSIVRMSFETFQMQEICGTRYLALDDTELFEGERRRSFADYVAIPALLLYMMGLPVLTMAYFWKQHSVMWTNHKMVFRFGLLYSGYAKDRWYWEMFVVARKIVLIFILTFGRSNASQLHFAMGVLFFMLYLQERAKPFEEHTESTSTKEKKQQHMLHLSEVCSLVVLLIMVWVAVFFNISPCTSNDWDCVVLSLLVLCSNLLFVGVCSYASCRAFVERNQLDKMVATISSLFGQSQNGSSGSGGNRRSTKKMGGAEALTLKKNPLAEGKNRLEFARQRTAANEVGEEVEMEVELVVVRDDNNQEQTQ